MRINNNRTLFAVLIGVFCIIAFLIVFGIDVYLAKFAWHNKTELESIFAPLKFLGNPTGYLVVSAIGALIFRYILQIESAWRYCLFFFLAVAGSGIVADIFKVIFWRARPWTLFDQGSHGFFYFSFSGSLSFPSGHTTVAAAVAVSLSVAFPRATPIVVFIPLSVGLSRMIVGAHYLSDVIAGLSIGVLFTLVTRAVLVRRGWLNK